GVILSALVCTFGIELYGGGDRIGLAERVAAGAEAVWPLIVVASWVALRR
ncbi:MAG: hypothetical protein QOI74_1166, partial [Micromonosporaceae bacterium]|nr:hypothetical protein [Micromonosporaceae bacterium]